MLLVSLKHRYCGPKAHVSLSKRYVFRRNLQSFQRGTLINNLYISRKCFVIFGYTLYLHLNIRSQGYLLRVQGIGSTLFPLFKTSGIPIQQQTTTRISCTEQMFSKQLIIKYIFLSMKHGTTRLLIKRLFNNIYKSWSDTCSLLYCFTEDYYNPLCWAPLLDL